MGSEHGGVLFFASKTSACGGLDHVDSFVSEHRFEGLHDVEGTLHGADEGESAILTRHCDHSLGLDIELLLMAHPVGATDDHAAVCLAPLVDADPLEDIVIAEDLDGTSFCIQRVHQGWQFLDQDLDVLDGSAGCFGRRCCHQGDGLFDLANHTVRQCGLILGHQEHHILGWNVGCGHDGDVGPIKLGVRSNPQELAMGDGASNGGSIQTIRRPYVVHILCVPPDFCGSICTGDVNADGVHARSIARCPVSHPSFQLRSRA